jgi:hypothetical protein
LPLRDSRLPSIERPKADSLLSANMLQQRAQQQQSLFIIEAEHPVHHFQAAREPVVKFINFLGGPAPSLGTDIEITHWSSFQ